MAERKVLIKYYPPNFDPERLIKNKRPKDKQDNVRMMLPMSLRCSTCGNYLYIGTKFNMRKETCLDEDYLGIRIYRFYLKCTQCYAEVTFKTDPRNSDYIVEHGGVRNYEPWRDVQAAEEALKEQKENEEEGNAMKFLENKTYDSKREMDILDALDEIKHLNQKKAQVGYEDLLNAFITDKTMKNSGIDLSKNFDEKEIVQEFRKRKLEEIDSQQQEESFAIKKVKILNSDATIEKNEPNFKKKEKTNLHFLKKKIHTDIENVNGKDSNDSEKMNKKILSPKKILCNYSDDDE